MRERWVIRPIVVSSSLVGTRLFVMIDDIDPLHATCLLFGREMVSRRKSHTQPKIVFTSLSLPSAFNFDVDTMGVRGIGSSSWMGRAHVCIARRGAAADIFLLFVPGMSIPAPTRSSRYISCVPLSLMFMSTMSSFPSANGMSSGRKSGGGMRC